MGWRPTQDHALATKAEQQGVGVIVKARSGPFGTVETIGVHKDDKIRFSTRFVDARGTVLDINHSADYPIKIEYIDPKTSDKRIVSYAPSEFISLTKESA